jgi:hypothetical protein
MNGHISACFTETTQTPTPNTVDSLAVSAFAALNWPMDHDAVRGTPDFRAPHRGTPDHFLDYVPVWQGWRARTDIFLPEDQPPIAWESQDQWLPDACKGLVLTDELRDEYAWAEVPESPLPPRLLSGYLNPGGDVLIDARGQPVRYEVLFNRQAYDYVVDKVLWSPDGLANYISLNGALEFPEGQYNFPSAEGELAGSRGAIIIKAAWKILDHNEPRDTPDRFHKAWAYVTPVVQDGVPRDGCEIVPVGLVGMHIIMKIDTIPGWLWSTFEHVALAPTWDQFGFLPGDVGANQNLGWLFFHDSRICSALERCDGFTALNEPPELTYRAGAAHPSFMPHPSRIVSQQPPGYYRENFTAECDSTENNVPPFACFNRDLQAGFEYSAVSKYVFKGAQWLDPSSTKDHGEETLIAYLEPEILANAAMESFNQATSNCYACHQYAGSPPPNGDDSPNPQHAVFDFIFSFERVQAMPTVGNLP